MKREAELQRRLHTLGALHEAISAMKSLSAHHLRQTRSAVAPARAYSDAVAQIMHDSGASIAAGDGAAGLLVVGAELGLCGAYNAQVVRSARAVREALGVGPTLCVGQRATSLLVRHGLAPERSYPAPTGAHGMTKLILTVAEDILSQYLTQRLVSFDIVSTRSDGVGSSTVDTTRLLPIEARNASPGATPDTRYATTAQLVDASIREYLYVTMYDRLLDALVAEHGARLTATQSAEKWLEQRSAQLRRHLTATRREASTQEMLEIAAGARARAHLARSQIWNLK